MRFKPFISTGVGSSPYIFPYFRKTSLVVLFAFKHQLWKTCCNTFHLEQLQFTKANFTTGYFNKSCSPAWKIDNVLAWQGLTFSLFLTFFQFNVTSRENLDGIQFSSMYFRFLQRLFQWGYSMFFYCFSVPLLISSVELWVLTGNIHFEYANFHWSISCLWPSFWHNFICTFPRSHVTIFGNRSWIIEPNNIQTYNHYTWTQLSKKFMKLVVTWLVTFVNSQTKNSIQFMLAYATQASRVAPIYQYSQTNSVDLVRGFQLVILATSWLINQWELLKIHFQQGMKISSINYVPSSELDCKSVVFFNLVFIKKIFPMELFDSIFQIMTLLEFYYSQYFVVNAPLLILDRKVLICLLSDST